MFFIAARTGSDVTDGVSITPFFKFVKSIKYELFYRYIEISTFYKIYFLF